MEKQYSFMKGYNKLKRLEIVKCREDIMQALRITSRPAWYNRLYGSVEPKASEATAIEEIFSQYGVTEIWGKN